MGFWILRTQLKGHFHLFSASRKLLEPLKRGYKGSLNYNQLTFFVSWKLFFQNNWLTIFFGKVCQKTTEEKRFLPFI